MPNDLPKTIPRALSGVRVLALEVSVAGPHCTRILGDMGAEVIKIEKPGTGDLIRNWDSAVRGLSSGYVWLNGNKRSFTIDVKKKAGLEAVLRLTERVDVVLENFAPGVAGPHGVRSGRTLRPQSQADLLFLVGLWPGRPLSAT
jgi:crotonobetainyl-CoA:carnitine CoA-transferase CaiB-like acyl-CoA transferase